MGSSTRKLAMRLAGVGALATIVPMILPALAAAAPATVTEVNRCASAACELGVFKIHVEAASTDLQSHVIHVQFSAPDRAYLIDDYAGLSVAIPTGSPITCTQPTPTSARCTQAAISSLGTVPGTPEVVGGAGRDSVTLDTAAEVQGGDGSDELAATPLSIGGEVKFDGGGGNDSLITGGGKADFHGGPGADLLTGAGANDFLDGGAGSDVLQGLAGADVIVGGPGHDRQSGGSGPDRLLTRDRQVDRRIDCGPGRDEAKRDPRDPTPISC